MDLILASFFLWLAFFLFGGLFGFCMMWALILSGKMRF